MSRKHAELEREFIEDLEPRTGRALAAWMSMIDDTGLTDRNAIIDWLRPQGLTFAHASWLERIHHNGGRPVYGDLPERTSPLASQPLMSHPPVAPAPAIPPPALRSAAHSIQAMPPGPPPRPAPAPQARATTVPLPPSTTLAAPSPVASPAVSAKPPPRAAATVVSVADLLARGKGLRPLADMLLREIAQALPGLVIAPAGDLVSLQKQAEFGVVLIGPKELRLGLDLGEWPTDSLVSRSRIPGTTARITHMVIVNDARQIGPPLIELVRRAAARTDPGT